MSSQETPTPRGLRDWFGKILRGLLLVFSGSVSFIFIAWATLAIYSSNLPWLGLCVVLALVFFVFGTWSLWQPCRLRRIGMFAVAHLGLLVWWSAIRPSHDRDWRADVAVVPRATIDGYRSKLSGLPNFEYRSLGDYPVCHEEREFDLSNLTSLDFYVSYWAVGLVGHTFVSFNFDKARPLCISIETRPEEGGGFVPIASLFKQLELINVVGDVRDNIGVRTNNRDQDVFLYRIRIQAATAGEILKVYLARFNVLAEGPEFYHLLSNRCTINIVSYANKIGRVGRLNTNHLLNGFIHQYLYSSGMIEKNQPFEELLRLTLINEVAKKQMVPRISPNVSGRRSGS